MNSYDLFPFSELFERTVRYLPSLLVPKDNLERIVNFVDLLPQNLPLLAFGFESHLNATRSLADLCLCIDLYQIDRERLNRLKECFKFDSLSSCLQSDNCWKLLSQLVERGVEGEFFCNKVLEELWLEFDVGSKERWPPLPNLFLDCSLNANPMEFIASLHFLELKILKRLETILRSADKHHLSPRYMGWMLGRNSDWFKIGFRPFSPEILEPFLREISYHRRVDPFLMGLITRISSETEKMYVQFDVHLDGLGPRIGIECFKDADLYSLLKMFVSEKLISAEEEMALLSWLGGKRYTYEDQQHEIQRTINHFKIVYEPEKPLQTKAYFGAKWQRKGDSTLNQF